MPFLIGSGERSSFTFTWKNHTHFPIPFPWWNLDRIIMKKVIIPGKAFTYMQNFVLLSVPSLYILEFPWRKLCTSSSSCLPWSCCHFLSHGFSSASEGKVRLTVLKIQGLFNVPLPNWVPLWQEKVPSQICFWMLWYKTRKTIFLHATHATT